LRTSQGKEQAVEVFLSGAEMQPERVRQIWPRARFVARAHLTPRPLGAVMPPRGAQYETWGIVLTVPAGAATGAERTAETDDGLRVAVVAPPPDDADPAAVLAAARYWELPPPYVRRLARAASAPVEESTY
jgi:hypothetical protein